MSHSVALPVEGRAFGIRLESVGGLGAHGAGEALARAAALAMGLNATQFSSHNPERKGTVVRTFVRLGAADRPIRAAAAVDAPDAIAVFHPALLRDAVTFAGLRPHGVFLYAGPPKPIPEELAALPKGARVLRVDAFGIAAKEKCAVDAPMLGALCAALGFLDAAAVLAHCNAALDAESVAARANGFTRGAKEMQALEGVGERDGAVPSARTHPAWAHDEQPFGGVLAEAGNTVWNDLTPARAGFVPVFNRERCIHCALCDLVCPDRCLVWQDGEPGGRFARELTGVDYRYCKGCMRCVETCPASCMTKKTETPGLAERLGVALFPDTVA